MIETIWLKKEFRSEAAIVYRDLVFETGKSYMLLGASGCGKSTLLNMIAGIVKPTSGKIIIDGEEMTAKTPSQYDRFRIEKIGYIFQDFKLIPEMTVLDNVNILRLEGIDTSDAPKLLEKLGLADQKNKKIRRLSGGQKQRVAIVRALVKKPEIILADEPTGNLNFEIGEKVVKELLENAKGKTLIAVSHDERLSKYFDCVIDMNEITSGKEGF